VDEQEEKRRAEGDLWKNIYDLVCHILSGEIESKCGDAFGLIGAKCDGQPWACPGPDDEDGDETVDALCDGCSGSPAVRPLELDEILPPNLMQQDLERIQAVALERSTFPVLPGDVRTVTVKQPQLIKEVIREVENRIEIPIIGGAQMTFRSAKDESN